MQAACAGGLRSRPVQAACSRARPAVTLLGFTFLVQLFDAVITPLMTRLVIEVFGEDFNVYQYIMIGSILVAVVASLGTLAFNRKSL